MEPNGKVDVQLAQADWDEMQQYMSTQSSFKRAQFVRSRVLWVLLIPISGFTALAVIQKGDILHLPENWVIIAGLAAFSAVQWFLPPWLLRRHIRRAFGSVHNAIYRQPYTIELSPSGVKMSSATSSSEINWLAVRSIERSQRGVIIFISAEQAYVIPASSFQTQDQFAQFVALAERYRPQNGTQNR